jgi:hypothetical protein
MMSTLLLAVALALPEAPCSPEEGLYFVPVNGVMFTFTVKCDGTREAGPTWKIEDMDKTYDNIHGKTFHI